MIGQGALFVPDASLPLRRRVEVEIITIAQARYALENFHYLHRCRTGRQINYAVLIDGVVDGVITMAYPSGAMTLLGLQPGEFVEFARLYLQHNIPHSATCAIGKVLRRFRADWLRLFPDAKPLQLVVSWSDQTIHKGTIYKAVNFTRLRESPGAMAGGLRRGHKRWGERSRTADLGHTKDCWVYWLVPPCRHCAGSGTDLAQMNGLCQLCGCTGHHDPAPGGINENPNPQREPGRYGNAQAQLPDHRGLLAAATAHARDH